MAAFNIQIEICVVETCSEFSLLGYPWKSYSTDTVVQGRLKIWTEHSTLILLILIPFKVGQQKFQDFYNLGRNEFSPNLKGVAQKMTHHAHLKF